MSLQKLKFIIHFLWNSRLTTIFGRFKFQSESKMFAYDSSRYLLFYASSFLKPNPTKDRVVFGLSLKEKIPLLIVLVIELIKNGILIAVPMKNKMRYIV